MINIPTAPVQRDGIFHYSKWQENGRIWICASVDWGGAHLDREVKDVCPEEESHTLYVEVEDEIVQGLYQTLKRRRNKPREGT